MPEELEVVDEKGHVIRLATAEAIHDKKLLHRSVHLLIVTKEGKIYCCYRDDSFNPGWTAVGAHVMPEQDYAAAADDALHKKLGLTCKLTGIGKIRVKGNNENEISETYVGHIDNDSDLKSNDPMWKGGKFLTVEEIKKLIAEKKTTPHLAQSLDLYLRAR